MIIPTINPDRALLKLLGQLSYLDISEIIIVRPKGKSSHFEPGENCKWLTAPKGRGSQIQCGLNAAQGDILWVLHADSVVHENAVNEIHHILKKPSISLGCFPLKFNDPSLSLKLFSAFSTLKTPLTTFGDQGFFFRKQSLKALPDLSPYPLLEDVVLYQALRKEGKVQKARFSIVTDARRFRNFGIWQTQLRNALTLWRFRRGIPVEQLYEEYYKTPQPQIHTVTSLSHL